MVDLLHVFPAADAQRAGDDGKAVFMGVERGAFEAHVEAHGAALAAFGFPFHAFGAGEPVIGVIVAINERDVVFFGEGDVFVFAQFVFAAWMDIGVVEEDGVVDSRGKQGFHDFARTGGAAGMQQDFVMAVGRDEFGALEGGFGVHGV